MMPCRPDPDENARRGNAQRRGLQAGSGPPEDAVTPDARPDAFETVFSDGGSATDPPAAGEFGEAAPTRLPSADDEDSQSTRMPTGAPGPAVSPETVPPPNPPTPVSSTPRTAGEPQPGQQLGRFELLRQLGRGGMGIVFEARPRDGGPHDGGPRVALKTLQPGNSLLRFKAEFHVLADLAHPNLVQLGELDTTSETPFFTMEIIRGCSFDEHVRSSFESAAAVPQLPFNERKLRAALEQLADGLTALHQAGCVHRDIKPSNVFVADNQRVVILDFGLAIDFETLRERMGRSSVAGTPYYMAPEVAEGRPITPASDWYSVGVMLFEALTGERIFQSRNFDALQQEKKAARHAEPKSIVPQVPDDLNDLCLRLLSPEPDQRPRGEAVLQVLRGETTDGAACAVRPLQLGDAWIGREGELARLHDAWLEVTQGHPRVVFVAGLSGLGKTALVDRFLAQLRSRERIVVLRGRCYESESVAYPGFDSVVDALAAYLGGLPVAEVERVLPVEVEALCRVFPVLLEVQAIRPHAEAGSAVFRSPREMRLTAIAALRDLLRRLAKFTKLVIFIDDLQQGDPDTAELFCELFGRDPMPQALVCATYRAEDRDRSECLKRIRDQLAEPDAARESGSAETIEIDRLGAAESMRLCLQYLRGMPGLENTRQMEALARRISDEAQGDPLFLRLLCSRPQQTGSWSLGELIDVQFDEMTAHEQSVIRRLAAAGRPVIDRVLESSDEDAAGVGTVKSLLIRRWVRRLGRSSEIDVFHDKIRERILGRISPEVIERDCLHLAELLEQESIRGTAGVEAESLAELFRRAGERVKSAGYCVTAAAKFDAIFAFGRAVQFYRWAIEQLEPGEAAKLGLREKLGHSLANASRSAEAAEEFLKAAEELASGAEADADRLRLKQLAAMRLLISGHIDEGIGVLQEVLRKVGLPWPRWTPSAVLGLLWRNARLQVGGLKIKSRPAAAESIDRQKLDACWTAAAGLSLVDPIRGAFFVSENLLLSLHAGDPSRLGRDLAAYMGHVAIGGSAGRRKIRRVLLASREVARGIGNPVRPGRGGRTRRDPYQAAMLSIARGIAALLQGRWAASRRSCDRAIENLQDPACHGATWERTTARTFALWALQYQGDLPSLEARQPELLKFAVETNDLFATLNFGTQVTAHLELAADRPYRSLERLDEDRGRLSRRGFFVQHHNELLARTYTLIYLGQGSAAYELIRGRDADYRRAFLWHVQQVRVDHVQVLVRAALAAAEQSERPAALVRYAQRWIQRLRRENAAWATALAEAFDASCEQLSGRRESADEKLRRAVQQLEGVRMMLFAAAARKHLDPADPRGLDAVAEQMHVKDLRKFAGMLLPGFANNVESHFS